MSMLALFADGCSNPSFFGFPTWYTYLTKTTVGGVCTPQVTNINDVWLIVAAVIGILLRVAALLAVLFVIYGGFQYVTSQGSPDATAKARGTIINALIGLLLSISAAAIIQFVAGRF